MKIKILGSAVKDLEDGYKFYEKQMSGLGDYFLSSLFSDIDSLHIYGGVHSKVFGFYRMLSKRFPYAIYYRLKGEEITVFAVLDCRQDPLKAKIRLS